MGRGDRPLWRWLIILTGSLSFPSTDDVIGSKIKYFVRFFLYLFFSSTSFRSTLRFSSPLILLSQPHLSKLFPFKLLIIVSACVRNLYVVNLWWHYIAHPHPLSMSTFVSLSPHCPCVWTYLSLSRSLSLHLYPTVLLSFSMLTFSFKLALIWNRVFAKPLRFKHVLHFEWTAGHFMCVSLSLYLSLAKSKQFWDNSLIVFWR